MTSLLSRCLDCGQTEMPYHIISQTQNNILVRKETYKDPELAQDAFFAARNALDLSQNVSILHLRAFNETIATLEKPSLDHRDPPQERERNTHSAHSSYMHAKANRRSTHQILIFSGNRNLHRHEYYSASSLAKRAFRHLKNGFQHQPHMESAHLRHRDKVLASVRKAQASINDAPESEVLRTHSGYQPSEQSLSDENPVQSMQTPRRHTDIQPLTPSERARRL